MSEEAGIRLPYGPPSTYDSARRAHPFLEELQELVRFRDLVAQWSARNIKLKYKRSALGVVWTLLEPLMIMVILTVVFSTAFRFPVPNFPVYLLSGLLVYNFLSRATVQITDEIVSTQELAKRIHFPRSAFAIATIVTHLTHWLVALLPLFGIMLVLRHPFSWALLTLPAALLLTALFALGVGLIVATLSAFFNDFLLTYQVLLIAWLYATPIIYPIEIVPDRFLGIARLNPLLHLCVVVRSPVYDGTVAPAAAWGVAAAASGAAAFVGWWVFTHFRRAFEYRS